MKNIVLLIFIVLLYACSSTPKTKVDFSKRIQTGVVDTLNDGLFKIGVAAMLSPREALPAYEALVEYIGQQMGQDFEMLFSKDYATMNELLRKGKVAAAFVCSGPYVDGHDNWGMQLVASPSLHGSPQYYSYLIVNKQSAYETIDDLEGKRFAFTDPKSNTGKLVPTYALSKLGRVPSEFFGRVLFTGSHDKSIEAVANNIVDGAAVDNLIWEYINSKDSTITSKTKVIEKFGPYCTPPVVVGPNCPAVFSDSLQKILLNMNNTEEGSAILREIMIDEFVITSDSDYTSVREMQNWLDKQN